MNTLLAAGVYLTAVGLLLTYVASGRRRVQVAVAALALLIAFFGMRAARNRPPKPEPGGFAKAVDLSLLDRVAVHMEGRLKSYRSFSSTVMQLVSGPHPVAGQSPAFTYLDLMFRPQAYDELPLIYVKSKQVRDELRFLLARSGMDEEWQREFMKTGLMPRALFNRGDVQELLGKLEQDVIRTQKYVDQIRNALEYSNSEFLGNMLAVVPPPRDDNPADDLAAPWFPVSVLSAAPEDEMHAGMRGVPGMDEPTRRKLTDAFAALEKAWQAQDAAAVNASLAAFCESLKPVNPGVYPDEKKLAWESWYFRCRNLTWIWMIYMLSVAALLMSVVYKWERARWAGLGLFAVAFGFHTFALGLRWYVSGRWPNSNMFEAVTTSAWFGGCCALALEFMARRSAMRNLFALGSAVASMTAMMAAHFLPMQLNPNLSNMPPILHDLWLYIHTNVIIFSYCLIAMAAVSAGLYLLARLGGATPDYAQVGGAGSLMAGGTGGAPRAASACEVFDGATMILMELSFVLLWAGIIMGAIWADHSWGRPWGWDPKEVFALNTFIIFLVLVHVRIKVKDKGLWTAILAVAGCGVMIFNWTVINFIISGLHSYA